MDYVGINASKKYARETDALVHEIELDPDFESPERGDDESNASCVHRCFPRELRLSIFTVCWVIMFAAFPFWIYTLRIPLSRYELFSNVFTFTFFFFSFFAWVIFLVNHFSPVAATLELLMRARPIQSEPLLARRVSVAVASIFCRERLFHVTRNFVGIAHSWHALSLVLEASLNHRQDQRTTFNHVHYVLDNSGAAGLPHFLRALVAYLARDPKLCHRLAPVLHHTPVQPTRQEYQQFLPKDLRKLIGTFLATHPDSYDAFAPLPDMPFDEVYSKYHKFAKESEKESREKRDGEVVVDLEDSDLGDAGKNASGEQKKKTEPKKQCCCPNQACGYAREDIVFRFGRLTVTVAVLTALGAQERAKAASLIHCANVYHEECSRDARFLAISDARHMMTPKFWIKTMPHFFRGKREVTSLRWVQVMQYFREVDLMEDYFDRGNFFTYLYSNALRAQIASTTSCGTNAVWAMRDHYDGTPFVFKGETKIEDTETSHHCFTYGEDSHYIAEKLVLGAVKEPVEYGEAPSRWAAGALQLLGVEVRRSPWILLSIFGIYFFTPFMLSFMIFFVERCHFIIVALEFVVLASLFVIVPFFGLHRHLARYLIRVVNVTYWLQGPFLAMYWMNVLPILLLVSPTFPVKVDVVFMVMGSCLILFLQWVMMTITKAWAGAKEIHIWRNQQVWYSLWPLMFAGIPLLCIGGKMWSISSNQSIFTFVINMLQIISICAASVFAVHDISSKVQVNQNQIQFQDMSICGSRIMGLMFAVLSLALIMPITISLLFMICGSKDSRGVVFSMRHLQLTFLIIVLISVSYMVGINWTNVIYNLQQKYALGFPIFTLPK